MKLIFATGNEHKVKEVLELLPKDFEIMSLKEFGITEDIPETMPTIEGNALQKMRYIKENHKVDCFSEDTGLEVMALNNEPGVFSARYAGPERDASANMNKVMEGLKNKDNRNAQFKTVVALCLNGKEHVFEGICTGKIALEQSGNLGFGYDPIFIPDGFEKSFAEMTADEKNLISHRGKAIRKLIHFLKNNTTRNY